MTVQTATHHIACCNVCGKRFDDNSEYLFWSDTPEQAIAWVEDDDHWTVTDDRSVVCPISDTAHYLARGHESPALLQPGPDAMAISFPPVPPLVEPRQHDWDDDPSTCGRADQDYWEDRYDTEPDDPSDHYYL